MSAVLFNVGSSFVGTRRAYIYVLFSKATHALYVGQTNDKNGVIGRLNAHVAPGGTFRSRLYEQIGIYLHEVDDLSVFAFSLPDNPEFTGIDRAYREGVEWLVHKNLAIQRGKLVPYVHVISQVVYNEAAELALVKTVANEIIAQFLDLYGTSRARI